MNQPFKGKKQVAKEQAMKFLVEIGYCNLVPMQASFSEILDSLKKVAGGIGTGFTINNVPKEAFEKMSKPDGFSLEDYDKHAEQIKPIVGHAEHRKGHPWWVGDKNGDKEYALNPSPRVMEVKRKKSNVGHFTRDRDAYIYLYGTKLYTTETVQSFLQKSMPAFGSFFEVDVFSGYATHKEEDNDIEMKMHIFKTDKQTMLDKGAIRKREQITREQMLAIINEVQKENDGVIR